MISLVETHDPVRLHYLRMVLEQAELHPFVVESPYRSLPAQLMVPEAEVELARRLIREAEESLG